MTEAEKIEAKKEELISLIDDLNFITSNIQFEVTFENGEIKLLPISQEDPIPF
jgi:hypothetical protein